MPSNNGGCEYLLYANEMAPEPCGNTVTHRILMNDAIVLARVCSRHAAMIDRFLLLGKGLKELEWQSYSKSKNRCSGVCGPK
jgi:ribosomal protein S14